MPRLHRALLVLSADERTVRHRRLSNVVLGLLVEGLGPIALLHLRQIKIVVVALEEFLDARPLELGLMLKHLL